MSQGPDASKDADSAAPNPAVPSDDESHKTSEPEGDASNGNPTDGSNSTAKAESSEAVAPLNSTESTSDSARPVEASAASNAEKADKADKAKSAPGKSRIPETEEALNIPKRQTVGMLGAMSLLTLVAWFAARLACNAHPDQVREPKHFSTKDLAADPKNAAFEFHHSFETSNYETALDLATGEVRKLVESKIIECERDPDACEEQQKVLSGQVTSVGRVLSSNDGHSTVELVSHYKRSLAAKTFRFEVVKQGDFYRVSSRKEVPNAQPPAIEPQVVLPAASAAPSVAAGNVPSVPSGATSAAAPIAVPSASLANTVPSAQATKAQP